MVYGTYAEHYSLNDDEDAMYDEEQVVVEKGN